MAAFEVLYYLTGFNNYYNRTIKLAEAASMNAYEEWILKYDSKVSFNPNDNVTTSHVVNYVKTEQGVSVKIPDEVDIDYVILTDHENNIISRWFVMDRTRNLVGQWKLSLRRDLIADFYTDIKRSPVFVEKGYIGSTTNKLIFNQENMSFNQIKNGEELLKDKGKTPWIVGYIAKDAFASDSSVPHVFEVNVGEQIVGEGDELSYSAVAGRSSILSADPLGEISFIVKESSQGGCFRLTLGKNTTEKVNSEMEYYVTLYDPMGAQQITRLATYCGKKEVKRVNAEDLGIDNRFVSVDVFRKIYSAGETVFKNTDSTGPEYFKVRVSNYTYEIMETDPSYNSNFYNYLRSVVKSQLTDVYGLPVESDSVRSSDRSLHAKLYCSKLEIEVIDVSNASRSIKMDLSGSADPLEDAPYIMFAMPWDDTSFITSVGGTPHQCLGKYQKAMAAEMAAKLGSALYDMQLLPYCPIPEVLAGDHVIDISDSTIPSSRWDSITDSVEEEQIHGFILFPQRSSVSFSINLSEEIVVPEDPVEAKIEIQTSFCRIVSPNYSGAFEFTPLKNGGFRAVEVNATYKPYQPYIHINPLFNVGFLYGGDYNDNRGLICGGDFTLPQVVDQWAQYLINNKSYMESFNRKIENIEIGNAVQREREIWSAASGVVSGIAGGAASGGIAGLGVPGAIVGGVIGGAAAAAGGIRDMQLNESLRKEALDYTKDQFGYSLQNIQALPSTMSRTSAFDINNKLFPFIETYTCTDEERDAFKKKLWYNGMTVMTVGKIEDFISIVPIVDGDHVVGSYIKGQIIRLLGNIEYHEAAEIANELNKGVFVINEYSELD